MASSVPVHVINALLPGCVIAIQGRVLMGLGLLLPAVGLLGLLLAGAVIADAAFWQQLMLAAGTVYLALAAAAAAVLWWLGRKPVVDTAQAQALYERCARHYLCDQHAEALSEARLLCRLIPHLPGSWQLLALCAESANDAPLAGRARRRQQRLLDA